LSAHLERSRSNNNNNNYYYYFTISNYIQIPIRDMLDPMTVYEQTYMLNCVLMLDHKLTLGIYDVKSFVF
jgi:hypothetical protein